jgi:uncharacterized membrane protein YraQ (UPF0718 family)
MLDSIVDFVVYRLGGLSPIGQWGKAVHFFLYEIILLPVLLLTVVFAISMIQTYLSPDRIRRVLGSERKPLAAVGGAMVGVVTPFCSCSAVPVFIGLLKAGAPAAGAFAFLIASPLINEIALTLIGGLFGWKIAALYIGFGTCVAILVGVSVDRLNAMGRMLPVDGYAQCRPGENVAGPPESFLQRVRTSWQASFSTLRRMFPYLMVAMAFGSAVHGFVPETIVTGLANAAGSAAVPAAVLVGIPLYSGVAVAAPVGFALAEKGVSIGTVIAFMMSVTSLSLPEFVMLRTILPTRSLIILAAIVAASVIGVGCLFNIIL